MIISILDSFLKIISESRPEGFLKPFGSLLEQATIACIGPITADEVQKNNLNVTIMPEMYTIDGLTQAIKNYFENVKHKK